MSPEGPIPVLDLRGFATLSARTPRAVLEVLVDGIEREGDEASSGQWTALHDDADDACSVFSYGPWSAPRSLPGRKARDAWQLAVDRGLVPPSWRDDPMRCFADQDLQFFCTACNGLGATGWNYDDLCSHCRGRGNEMVRGRVPLPTELWNVEWMLSHPLLVERAEALARKAVARLGDAGPGTQRVQWGRLRTRRPHGTVPVVLESPVSLLAQPRPARWDRDAMRGPAFSSAPWWPIASGLPTLTRELLCFDVGLAWHHQAARVTCSPMEPVLRLWELGVMIEELTPDAIVLEPATRRHLLSWRSGVSYG